MTSIMIVGCFMAQMQLLPQALTPSSVVYTPDWCAKDMVAHFKPFGKVLEPCFGDGAIYKYLPAGSEWCEIAKGRDFFAWIMKVDFIISNPPFDAATFSDWLEHSFSLAPDIVYLLPIHFFFRSASKVNRCRKLGWIKHVRFYGTGTDLSFHMGNPIAAMHFVRGYQGDTSWSWYAPNKA